MAVYRIGKHTFGDVIAKRVVKDGLGFFPINNWKDSATDRKSYIKSTIPKSDEEFLVYCHELGHCKSKQPRQEWGFSALSWCNGRLQCEYNAWVWALKYFRRLGLQLTDECRDVIVFSLESYFSRAKDWTVAKKLSEDFEKWCGVKTNVKESSDVKPTYDPIHITISFGNPGSNTWYDEASKFKTTCQWVKPKNWKPWHDLKNNQFKKAWKNQR